jgi:hypothetical protein
MKKKLGDWYWNGFFIYFLTWKLSYILFNFAMFIDMPLSVIYFNGGTNGHLLALTLLSLYLFFLAGKKFPGVFKESTSILLFFLIYEVMIHLLQKDWIEGIGHFIVLAGYFMLLITLNRKEKLITIPLLIIVLLMELLVLSLFSSMFTLEALTFIWIGLIVLILSKKNGHGGLNT